MNAKAFLCVKPYLVVSRFWSPALGHQEELKPDWCFSFWIFLDSVYVCSLLSSCYALCWTSPLLLVVNRWCGTSCFLLCSQRHGLCLSHPLCCTAAWSLRTGYLSKCDCEIYALNNKRCMVAHDHIFLFHILFEFWMPTAKPFFFYLTICHLYVVLCLSKVIYTKIFMRVPFSK